MNKEIIQAGNQDMTERLDNAFQYLIDLLRAYGKRAIIVNITSQGKEIHLIANEFVKRQLAVAGIHFPFNETVMPNVRKINKQLDTDMLSVIFHEAIFELEDAYVRVNCEGDPRAERYVEHVYSWIERRELWLQCTFPPYNDEDLKPFLDVRPEEKEVSAEAIKEAKEKLSELGIETLSTIDDVNKLFWELALRGLPLTKVQKEAFVTLITDNRVATWFSQNAQKYNPYIQKRIEDPQIKAYDGALRRLKGELSSITSNYNQLKENYKNYRIQRGSIYMGFAKKFIGELNRHNSRFQLSFDFSSEEEVAEYLSWFKALMTPVNQKTIYTVSRYNCPDDASRELFLTMVKEHNMLYSTTEVDEDFSLIPD